MSEMVERVARAMFEMGGNKGGGNIVTVDGRQQTLWEVYRPIAIAAIAAMREPTKEMAFGYKVRSNETDDVWRSMIDAALAKGFDEYGVPLE